MKILVCVKRVPAPGARINVTEDGREVDSTHLGFTTSPHEECAVEEAVQLAESHGGEVTAITLGPEAAEEQLRYAASVGVNNLVLLPIDEPDWDPQKTADALTKAITEIESSEGVFDLILFGNESADAGGFQVGIRVSHQLGRPIVNGIKNIEIADNEVEAQREIDGGFEVYKLPIPAALGVREGINLPRYPTMKGRLASKKAELKTLEFSAADGGQKRNKLHRPEEQVSETVILGNGPEAAPAIVDLLEELGVLQ
ncbi:MAG: electron transfer flavoprotein subunit beta/FixA family protein [Actinomycetota bacterium]|nr:electron transfer flavoprotein subunit beta/FixA family protein [Actinomycetota bacterium]